MRWYLLLPKSFSKKMHTSVLPGAKQDLLEIALNSASTVSKGIK
jgi:hypothetical protein